MKVLELFSGIGGMHLALQTSGVEGEIKTSIDINPAANLVYKHNFPHINLLHRNIDGLTAATIAKMDVDTILMSPPCQPFTRNGLQADIADERTKSFRQILTVLPALSSIKRVLVENVVGFEKSQMRDLFVQCLTDCSFVYQEFILSPTQFGIPNSRRRYYCIAKKPPLTFSFEVGTLKYEFPVSLKRGEEKNCFVISQILEQDTDLSAFYLEDKVLLNYFNILDICHADSRNTCCFTKAYGRYIEGCGSVYTEKSEDFVRKLGEEIVKCTPGSDEFLKLVKQCNLRFFTPREICRLMGFPEHFRFPKEMTFRKQCMLLGNSLNVHVVAELVKLLS